MGETSPRHIQLPHSNVTRFLCVALLCASAAAGFCSSQVSALPVGWSVLKTLKLGAPASEQSPARQLNGKRVIIPGFMVPLEDDADNVSEFLLVPFAGACIHVPPPPPNQIVHVTMLNHAKAKMSFTDPITVTGTLKVVTVQSPYGDVSYDLQAEEVKPYQGGA